MPTKLKQHKRKRNRSSPTQQQQQHPHHYVFKKHKSSIPLDIESDASFYSADSETEEAIESNMCDHCKFTKEDLNEVASKMVEQFKSQLINELTSVFENIVENKTKKLQEELTTLKCENSELRACIKTTNTALDDMEQYGRRFNLNITGIPGDNGDYNENVEQKILDYAKKANIDITSSDINNCHRLGKPRLQVTRRVIVQFTNTKAVRKVYDARKNFGNGVYIQESLTRAREQLAYEARKLKRENKLDQTWVAGGRIVGIMNIRGTERKFFIRDMIAIQSVRNGVVPSYTDPSYP